MNDPAELEVSAVPTGRTDDQTQGATGEAAKPLTLLTMSKADMAQRMIQDWEGSYRTVRKYIEIGKVNRARELGYLGAKLVKVQDEQRMWLPTGATPSSGAVMNKALRLKRRVRATIFADAPIPECTPSTDADEDRDAAEFSTRALENVTAPGYLAYHLKAGNAFDLASTWGSGYMEWWVDPQGGGWVPQEVLVAPEAMQLAGAMDEEGHPVIPGSPNPDGTPGQPVVYTGDPVQKYVKTDGTLTTDRADPDLQKVWRPALCQQLHTLKNVRLLPSSAADLWEADGVQIGRMIAWGQLKADIPKLATISDEEKGRILRYRPQNGIKDLIPATRRADDGVQQQEDDTLVFCLKRYHSQSAVYPKGFYGLVLGNDYVCERTEWYDERRSRPLSIPATQFKQYQDGEPGENPNGAGVMTDLGPGNEARGQMLGTLFDHLDKFRKRKTFLPYTSNLQPQQLMADSATVLHVMPNQEPKYEDLPDFPRSVEKMYEMTTADMDDASGLQQGGQGVNTASVKSGLHAQQIIEQINVLLSEPKQNCERGLIRGWQVMLELMAAKFDVPQRISWVGEDGAYKEQEWTGADLGSTTDVQIHRGSFTQLAPSAKAAVTESLFTSGFLDLEEAKDAVTGNLGGLLKLQDNPHRQRVRRQIGRWQDGPPEDWQPPVAPMDEAGNPLIDPQTQQPQPPPPDPVVSGIFAPRDCDEEPDVAKIRLYELGRAMATSKFNRWPQAWQDGLTAEYLRMRQAAGVQTVAEQAQAQQQAAEQQAQLQRETLASKEKLEAGKLAVAESKIESDIEQAALDRALAAPPEQPQPAGVA